MTWFAAIVLALAIRTFAFEPFSIPSAAMLPTLEPGDYVFVAKFAYGYSRYSFPFGRPELADRMYGFLLPERGDVVVFKLPRDPRIDYIKRIAGVPGDRIQMKGGVLYVNDAPARREAVGPFPLDEFGGTAVFTEYVETLPDGRTYRILKRGDDEPLDDTPEVTVPPGRYYMLGDNRDNSADSRVPSSGVGFVPLENIIGRAVVIYFSTAAKGSERIFKLIR